MLSKVRAIAFDCFGTLIDFDDLAFSRAFSTICAEQGLDIGEESFWNKWMEVFRRAEPHVAESSADASRYIPSGWRSRALDGPLPVFRTAREEWTTQFAACFEELDLRGDPEAAYVRLCKFLVKAQTFPDARQTIDTLARHLPVALLSNADDDFLYPVLSANELAFSAIVSSEAARVYKPHVAIFRKLAEVLMVESEAILYVGDSFQVDVLGAINAGMIAGWVNRGRAKSSLASASISYLELSSLGDLPGALGFNTS